MIFPLLIATYQSLSIVIDFLSKSHPCREFELGQKKIALKIHSCIFCTTANVWGYTGQKKRRERILIQLILTQKKFKNRRKMKGEDRFYRIVSTTPKLIAPKESPSLWLPPLPTPKNWKILDYIFHYFHGNSERVYFS